MKINNFKDFVALLEYYESNKSFDKIDKDPIEINGIAGFNEYLLEVQQYVETKVIPDNLSPLKTRLYEVLNKISEEERNRLMFSTLTSYFTPENITQPIAAAVLDYFNEKNVNDISILEPSAGSGNFIKALVNENKRHNNQNITIDAVEIESITASILEKNFSTQENIFVKNTPYQDFKPKEQYELIISNIPFGNYSIYDPTLNTFEKTLLNNRVHNYFFIKATTQLKPGGLLVFITSKEITDSLNDEKTREHLVNELNLIRAIRLPDTVFKDAKTSVVTDVLIFQKPLENKISKNPYENLFIKTSPLKDFEHQQNTNDLYKEYPNLVLGDFYQTRGIKGLNSISVKENDNLSNLQQLIVDGLNTYALENITFTKTENLKEDDNQKIKAEEIHNKIVQKYPYIEKNNLIEFDNKFYIVQENPQFQTLETKQAVLDIKDYERALYLIELRESFKLFREAVRNQEFEKAKTYQKTLNNNYDNFSFFYNNINSLENKNILYLEGERALLKSLEKEITPGEFQKSDIFSQTEFLPRENEKKLETVDQAIFLSINKYGKIDDNYITEIYQKEKEDWITEALEKKLLYINPIFNNDLSIKTYQLDLPSKFISGYVEKKIEIYNNILRSSDRLNVYKDFLNRNLVENASSLLAENIPYKLSIQEIDPSLGEPWLSPQIFEQFGKEHLGDFNLKILYDNKKDKFKVLTKGSQYGNVNYSVEVNNKRISYNKIFEYALVQNAPDFTKLIEVNGKQKRVSNKELNTAVQVSIEKLQNSFSEWLMTKETLSNTLENQYHFLNNANVKEIFNSNYLEFNDIVGFAPHIHQKLATEELVINNGGILDHKVGFGKTLSMAMITMTKKRFGIGNKELVCGLTANFIDIHNAFQVAYPNGKFLLVTSDDVNPKNKEATYYKIANNNWDAVITSHDALMNFPTAPHTEKKVIDEIINDLQITLENKNDEGSKMSSSQVKELMKKLNDAENKQKELISILYSHKNSGSIIFDDLGFTGMTIDESHYFKNLEFSTIHRRIAGLGANKEVQKTRNLLSYIRNIQEKNIGIGKCGGITFASGTTISNSIAELYNLFRYLIPGELQKKGIRTFDQWARVYARKTSEYEENVTGSIKQKERFRYFVKVPELAKMYYDITNFADEKSFSIEKPNLKFESVIIEQHPALTEYLEALKNFGETKKLADIPFYKGNSKDGKKAVGLICTNLGKKASLSLKLIDKSLPDDPNDKINTAVKKIVEIYTKFNQEKGTQLIFCDQGVPDDKKDFNIYSYTKNLLINAGIPSNEIAFIHSYNKNKSKLYKSVNNGEIRIVLGSTGKMGTGVNMQQRIVAMHHFDLPWRPSDLDQRNGRGGRPGNILLPKYNNELLVYSYLTKNTTDSYSLNILQIKQNFIYQIKNASISTRRIDEGSIDANGNMNYNEYMAACSPNQYLTQKLIVEKDLQRYLDQKTSHIIREKQNKTRLNSLISNISKCEKEINSLEKDLSIIKSDFNYKIYNGVEYFNAKEITSIITKALEKKIATKVPGEFLLLDKGFSLQVNTKDQYFPLAMDNYSMYVKTPNNKIIGYNSKTLTKKAEDVAAYTTNALNRLPNIIQEREHYSNELKKQKEVLTISLAEKFKDDNKIIELKDKIKNLEKQIENENKNLNTNKEPEDKNKPKFKR